MTDITPTPITKKRSRKLAEDPVRTVVLDEAPVIDQEPAESRMERHELHVARRFAIAGDAVLPRGAPAGREASDVRAASDGRILTQRRRRDRG